MKIDERFVLLGLVRVLLIALLLCVPAGEALSQADFYKGKTIKIVRGGGPGGSSSTRR